jgi:hypothetical protein
MCEAVQGRDRSILAQRCEGGILFIEDIARLYLVSEGLCVYIIRFLTNLVSSSSSSSLGMMV